MTYIRKKSQKQENRTAKEFGGRATIASGAIWTMKADVRTGGDRTSSFSEEDYLIENKFTDKDFFKLERKIWEKVKYEAISDDFRTPLMQVDIQELQLVIMDYNDFLAIFEDYKYEKDYELSVNITKNKSFKLEKDILSTANDNKYFSVQFIDEKIGGSKHLNLIIMLNETFLNR